MLYIYSRAIQGKKKDKEKKIIDKNVISNNNNIRYRENNGIINNSSKNNKIKNKPNKFNNFIFFYPLRNINSNAIYNNNIIKRENKKTKNKKLNKYNINFKADNLDTISHLSTTSGGDYNNYNKINYKDFKEENKSKKNNENLFKSIKKGINDMKNCINSNPDNSIPLSCYYYCNLNMNEQQKLEFENHSKIK